MGFFALLHLFTLMVYFGLLVYVLAKNPKPLLKRLCAMFLACLCIWSFANIQMHSPGVSAETALLISKISGFGWISFGSFFLWLILVFGKYHQVLQKKALYFFLLLMPAFFIAAHWNGLLVADVHREPYGWHLQWSESIITYLFFLYYISSMGLGLFFAARMARSHKDPLKRKQAGVIFITSSIALVGGSLTDVLLPLAGYTSIPTMATFFGLIWAYGLVYAMVKHKFMDILPASPENNIKTTMFDCLLLLSHDGEIMSCNDSTLNLLGFKEDELLGQPLKRILENQALQRDLLNQIIRHKNLKNRQLNFKSKKGKRVPVTFSSSLLRDDEGEIESIVCVARDLTQSIRNQTVQDVLLNISESSRRTATLTELLAQMQLQVSRLMDADNFFVTLVSDRENAIFTFPFMTDVNPNEIIAPEEQVPLPDSFTHYVVRTEKALLANEDTYKQMETQKKAYLVGLRPKAWMGVPLIVPGEEVMGVIVVQSYQDESAYSESDKEVLSIISNTIADVIKSKQVELERKALEEKLARSEKMEAIGQLAGGVAHDLNNVLTAIVSYPDLLLRKLPQDSPLRKAVITIQKSGQKAAAIVQDLLTLARRGVHVMKPLALNKVVAEYLDSPEFRKLRKYHPYVKINLGHQAAPSFIKGSAIHLTKTVMNLVSNAAEAIESQGNVTISTQTVELTEPVKGYYHVIEPGSYVVLSVKDNGIGISPEDLEMIFDPFYTKKEMGRSGTGLGMSVVWGTVEDHNGFIDVHSSEGQGTCFSLYFPRTDERPITAEIFIPVCQYTGNGEKILVVDDDPDQREIASILLNELNYTVETVSSGEDAVEYIKTNSAHLILLDMIMGGIDGLETFCRIRDINPLAKVLIISGFSESERVKEALANGAKGYIRKPYTLEKIGMALAKGLK